MLAARRLMFTPAGPSITDTFDRPNSSSLGTTSDGNWTWTDLSGGRWTIASNLAHCIAGAGTLNLAVIDFGAADGTLQLDIPALSVGISTGLCFRVTDSSNNYNIQITSGAGNTQVYRYISGAAHQVGGNFTVAAGNTLSVVMSGTSVTVLVNGASATSFTDSTYTTNTKHGIFATGGLDVDNFNWIP